jgi:hypothetical protein
MATAFTTYWSRDVCDGAKKVAQDGVPMQVLFGGPHQSQPSFVAVKVAPGDLIYPVTVSRRTLYVLGRLTVREVIDCWDDTKERLDERELREWRRRAPQWRFLCGYCTTEVVVGADGTPVRLDVAVPADITKTLAYQSPRQGVRRLRNVTEDGSVTNISSLQGIYRLTDESARDLDAVLGISPPAQRVSTLGE